MIIFKEWIQSQKTYFRILLVLAFISLIYIIGPIGTFRSICTQDGKASMPDLTLFGIGWYKFVCFGAIVILVQHILGDEFKNGTFSFLLIKPISKLKLFSVKYILGCLQSLSFAIIPFIGIQMMHIDIYRILTVSEYINSIIKMLFFAFGIYSFLFCFQLYIEKGTLKTLYLLPFCLIVFIFSVGRMQVGIMQYPNEISNFLLGIGLISNIFSFLSLQYSKIKMPIKKIFSFIGAFLVSTTLVLLISLIIFFLCHLLKSGELPTVLKSIIITPLFTFQHQTFLFPPVADSGIPILLQNLLGFLGGIACAYYIFWDSKRRVDRKNYSALWAIFGFLFTFVGLICYLSLKNKGVFKNCPSCGRKKLSYIYPCQYCGYHFDKESKSARV